MATERGDLACGGQAAAELAAGEIKLPNAKRRCNLGSAIVLRSEQTVQVRIARCQGRRDRSTVRRGTNSPLCHGNSAESVPIPDKLGDSVKTAPGGSSPGPRGCTHEQMRALPVEVGILELLLEAASSLAIVPRTLQARWRGQGHRHVVLCDGWWSGLWHEEFERVRSVPVCTFEERWNRLRQPHVACSF